AVIGHRDDRFFRDRIDEAKTEERRGIALATRDDEVARAELDPRRRGGGHRRPHLREAVRARRGRLLASLLDLRHDRVGEELIWWDEQLPADLCGRKFRHIGGGGLDGYIRGRPCDRLRNG